MNVCTVCSGLKYIEQASGLIRRRCPACGGRGETGGAAPPAHPGPRPEPKPNGLALVPSGEKRVRRQRKSTPPPTGAGLAGTGLEQTAAPGGEGGTGFPEAARRAAQPG